MAYNAYLDVGTFENRIGQGQAFSALQVNENRHVLEGVSRFVDSYCNRFFYALTATRKYNGNGNRALDVPDLLAVTALSVDNNDDLTYELSLVEGTDYDLVNPDSEDAQDIAPYSLILLRKTSTVLNVFPRTFRAVQIAGRWGYTEATEALLTSAGSAVTGTLASSSATSLTTSAAAFPEISPGMTLKIESEQIYVLSGRVSPFVVARGVNGTTAAAHAAQALSKYVYESDVVEATILQAQRIWERKQIPILPTVAAPGIGDVQLIQQGLDPDIAQMLRRVRRLSGSI